MLSVQAESILALTPEEFKEHIRDLYAMRDGFLDAAKCADSDYTLNPELAAAKIADYERIIKTWQDRLDHFKECRADQSVGDGYRKQAEGIEKRINLSKLVFSERDTLKELAKRES